MKGTAEVLEEILDVVRGFLQEKRLDQHVARVRVYNDTCSVIDFSYKEVNFAFDVTPAAGELVSLDCVQRRCESGFRIVRNGEMKESLARNVSLREALDILHSRVIEIFSGVDGHAKSLRSLLDEIARFSDCRGFGRHISKISIHKTAGVIVDISSLEVGAAFKFILSDSHSISLEWVRQKRDGDLLLGASEHDKSRLANEVSLNRALALFDSSMRHLLSATGQHMAASNENIEIQSSAVHEISSDRNGGELSKPMKIGVLTLPLNANIGGNLQAYALIEALRQLGHEPFLLNRRHAPEGFREDAAISELASPLMASSIGISKSTPNRSFTDKHIRPVSRIFQSTAQLARTIGQYEVDAIVVGSDQIWRPKYAKGVLLDFFLEFLPEEERRIRRISYAASFGAPHWEFDPEQTRKAATLIERFHAVSVREDSAVDLCRKNLGVDAKHVLDPTMLLAREHYAGLLTPEQRGSDKGRVLTYILDTNGDKAKVVDAVAQRLSAAAYSTDGRPFGAAGLAVEGEGDKTVEGWLAAFHNAAFVMTDSFHGMVFSILFNKPFIAYGNPNRGMARFSSLVKMFGLEDRLVVKAREVDLDRMLAPIDWQRVNRTLEVLRAESRQFLVSALSGRAQVGELHALAARASIRQIGAAIPTNGATGLDFPPRGLCTGCGICVSESRDTLRMAWNNDGFLVPQAKGKEIPAEAVRVCPFNPRPEKAVEDEDALAAIFLSQASKIDGRGGRFENTYIGYSKMFRPSSSSGGVATYVFQKLLERKYVDYLYIVQTDGGGGYKYQVFNDKEDISKISKTRYFPVTLAELFSVIERTEGRVAVSGVACFIKALRLKQYYHPELREKIPFLVGIICGGLKSRFYTDFLAQSAGIRGSYTNPEYRVKDPQSHALDYSFSATDAQSQTHSVKMRRVGDMWGTGFFKAKACDFCTDVLTELADISLGDAWLPEYRPDGLGNSVVVTRSPLAEEIIRSGMAAGDLVIDEVPISQVLKSQGGGLGHKQSTLKFRVAAAERLSDDSVPAIRRRLFKDVSVTEAIIQIHRERTRAKSLRYWGDSQSVDLFVRRMRSPLKKLNEAMAARRTDTNDALAAVLDNGGVDAIRQSGSEAAVWSHPLSRWLSLQGRGAPGRKIAQVLRIAIAFPVPVATSSLPGTVMSVSKPAVEKQTSPFKPMTLPEYRDVALHGATLQELIAKFGVGGKLDYTTQYGNRIVCEGADDESSAKQTRIFFSGRDNVIRLGKLRGISRLDIACIGASQVSLGRSEVVRGITIMASHRATIAVGNGCMLSRDIMIYASGAHGLYNSADGKRRGSANIQIGSKVWIGQGARILSGALVGDGSVIGSYSVLAGKVPNNCAAAGNPCRVTSRNIFWTAESVSGNYFDHLTRSGKPMPIFVKMTEDI